MNGDIGAIIELRLRRKDKAAVIDAINRLMSNPCVLFAEPDFFVNMHVIPNDRYFRNLWGMEDIRGPQAWNFTTGSGSVVVGVIDSGVELGHPDLRDNMVPIPGGTGLGAADRTGHGTHVAGTIGAVGNNRIGVTGVCWRVRMVSMKIGNYSFDVASAIKAIDLANRNGVSILNASWGMRHYSPALKYAIDNYNGLFIASAGNDGSNNDRFPIYPASYDSRNIISVASIDSRGRLSTFSNFGVASVQIAAPGSDILSTTLRGGYSTMSGTSMSAPHVAGAAALLKSYIPGLAVWEIRNIILSSAEPRPNLNGRVATGGALNVGRMMNMAAGIRNTR